ncbi:MAG: response regulator [Oscillibacter sp.]|nr:response regulator [Oscillibacter sp.]
MRHVSYHKEESRTNKILIADDDNISRSILQTMLEMENWEIRQAENGQQAIDMMEQEHFSCLLLGIHMPEKNGFDVLAYMKKHGFLTGTSVIIITGEESRKVRDKAFSMGASDVIQKPFDRNLVIRRVRIAAMLSEQSAQINQFRQQVDYDYMTGLLNKKAFFATVKVAMEKYDSGAFYMLDIDGMKTVNDSLGHMAGDAVIKKFGSILSDYFTDHAIIGHLSGDEFAVYVPGQDNPRLALEEGRKLLDNVQRDLTIPDLTRVLSSSVGIAMYPQQAAEMTTLYNLADYAMLYVKNHGRSACHLFEAQDNLQEEAKGREECTYSDVERVLAGRREEQQQLWVKYSHFHMIWSSFVSSEHSRAAAGLITFSSGTEGRQIEKQVLHPITEKLNEYIRLNNYAGVFSWYSQNEFLLMTYQLEEMDALLRNIAGQLAPLLRAADLTMQTSVRHSGGMEEEPAREICTEEADPIFRDILCAFVDVIIDLDLDTCHYKAYRYNTQRQLTADEGMEFADEVNRYLQESVHPDDRAGVFALENVDMLRTCFQSGQKRVSERYRIRRDNQWVLMETLIFFTYANGHRHAYLIDRNVKETAAVLETEKKWQDTEQDYNRLQMSHNVNEELMDALAAIVEYRDMESGEHIKRIKGYTRLLAETVMQKYPEYDLTPDKINHIVSASALHDIGKIAIPDHILLKPGRLTQEEFELMKKHSIRGSEIIRRISGIQDAEYTAYCYDITRYHHERYDGGGYPDGLAGDDIPISAQIASLADVYDALINKQIYKDAYSLNEAFEMICTGKCGIFNPKIILCFQEKREGFEKLARQRTRRSVEERLWLQHALNFANLRVLVVDDVDVNREILCHMVQNLGATAIPADSVLAAIRMVAAAQEGYFDMIFTDINMPDTDGYTAVKRIRLMQRHDVKTIPIVAVTANSEQESGEMARDCGISRFIHKPVRPEMMLTCMEDLLPR